MSDVFISYPSENKDIADAVCHYLEAASIKCWYAPRDIKAGMVWEDAIMDAISNCKVFILIFSDNANHSKHVINEVREAFNAQCTIIPFRVDRSQMSRTLSYYLDGIHWLDAMNPPLELNIEKLCQHVTSIIGKNLDNNRNTGKTQKSGRKHNAMPAFFKNNFTTDYKRKNSRLKLSLICTVISVFLLFSMIYLWSTSSQNSKIESPQTQTTNSDIESTQNQTTTSKTESQQDQTTTNDTQSPQDQTTNMEQDDNETCWKCNGSGICSRCSGTKICYYCEGTSTNCYSCGGTGQCYDCSGSGSCYYCNGTGILH